MNNNMNIIYPHSQLSPIQQCQAAVALRSFCDDSLRFDYSVSDIIYLAKAHNITFSSSEYFNIPP